MSAKQGAYNMGLLIPSYLVLFFLSAGPVTTSLTTTHHCPHQAPGTSVIIYLAQPQYDCVALIMTLFRFKFCCPLQMCS